jgi:hypothetical protein
MNISQFTNNSGYLTSAVTSLAGTTNRITVSGATGAVTLNLPQDIHTGASPTFAGLSLTSVSTTGATITNLTGAYQNTTVYDSPRTQSATPSRGIRAPASSIQFTDSYAIAPFYTYRSTGDWPVPYGIGWGTGGESSGIFQRYASNGYSFGDMIFYTGNDGSGAFSFRRHTWEGTTYFAAGSGELNTELFRIDWAGKATATSFALPGGFTITDPGSGYAAFSNWVLLGTTGFYSSTNSAHLLPNPGTYGSWKITGTRGGWHGIEFDSGVSLMANSNQVGFHRNGYGWQMWWSAGTGYVHKGDPGGGTQATILDSSNQAYAWAMNQNVTTTSSPTFSELTLSGQGMGAYNLMKYSGIRSGNWQTFTTTEGQLNVIQVNDIAGGAHTNYPTGVYTYGAVMSWRTNSHSFQLYAAHTGDLAYKTQWGNDNYSGWRRILDSTNYIHAANMNQYVRTTDTCSFAGLTVSNTINGSVTGNAATVTNGMYLSGTQTISGIKYFQSNLGTTLGSLSDAPLQAFASGTNSAFMSFHRGGSFAVNFGLDSDNVLRIGGWSAAANRLQLDMSGNLTLAGVVDATQFRDSSDTTYFVDPAGTSNLNKLSTFTMGYNDMNPMHIQSPYVARYNGSSLYRNGTMGYGTTDCNVMFSNWGSGFIDSWSSPANAPGGSTHYVGFQGFHYNHQNNSQAYGFQMLYAGGTNNRFFWRSAWPDLYSWVEMIHSGNIGSQTVATAGSCTGNAATATTTDNINGRPFVNTNSNSGTNADTINSNGISYYTSGVTNFSGNATDGALFSQAYSNDWQHQIAGDYRSGQIALRGKNGGTWQSWRRVLDQTNASYAWNMNQNVRTTDTVSFAAVSATTFTGALSGNATSATSATSATTATNSGCITSDTGNVGENRLQYWQTSGNTTLNPDGEWYNAIRMGHGNPVTYYSNTLAVRMTGGNLGDIYTRTTTNGATGSWNRFWHNNNDGAGSGLDADLLDGNGSATANTANTIVLRDGSGNFSAGTITAALSGNATTATTLQTARTIGGVSFNGSANINLPGVNTAGNQNTSGNAATATSASFATTAATATNVSIANGSIVLAKIENITAYTILGNSNASAAATPAALSVATVATMLSGQTMNIAGSSTSISGFNNPATAATANTIAYRDANGDLSARYFFGSYQNSSDDINTGNISHIMAKFGDNYHRSATAAKVAAFITGQTMNIAGSSTSCTGNSATATNATTAGGLAVQSGTNYDANKIVRTDGNGYILAGWINTISGDNGTTAIDRVYASQDGYIRYYTPANFRTVLDVPTRNGSGVTNFGINTAPSNRLHINGDGTNPAIRVDNGAVVLAASAASNSKTFYGWLPISIAGTTKWIQMYN